MGGVVTFLSDFGTCDAYVAQVKARILSAVPDVRIVDITHDISSYAVLSGAWLLFTSYSYFPKGTIHLAVVDPGVGTDRPIIIVKKNGHIFIGPDNGIFSFLYPADKVIEATWRPNGEISPTFHGRDIFAPIAAKLVDDPAFERLGTPLETPVMLDIHKPMVVHVDKFGNVVTNLECSRMKTGIVLRLGKSIIDRIARTFSDIPDSELALVCGSSNTIEISASRGSAAQMTGAYVGMPIQMDFPGSHA